MKKQFLVLAVVTTSVIIIAAISCKRNLDQQDGFSPRGTSAGWSNPDGLPLVTLPTIITGTVALSSDTCYVLNGKCYIDDGGLLEIPAGTRIEAVKGTTSENIAAIVVTRGGKINARGDEEAPVVFTSHEECPASGDWGGIVLLGKAPLNRGDAYIEGINPLTVPTGIDVSYGGGGACLGDVNDNSGILNFVRIEFAGFLYAADDELNGLTCGGVGAGTTLDHIEVSYGNDDAFEFFGGTVNAKYLIALAPDDDAFDFDFGYNGNIQFAVSILRPDISYSANPNGIESDNNGTADANTCKRTSPTISNMTVIGMCDSTDAVTAGLLNAALFRRASEQVVRNSVFMGYPTGVNFQSATSIASAPNFQYNTVQAFTTVFSGTGATLDATNRGIRSANANDGLINLADACDACSPDFKPRAGSSLLTDPVSFAGLSGFFTTTTYRGACAGSGAAATWPNSPWVKYDYPPYCVVCN